MNPTMSTSQYEPRIEINFSCIQDVDDIISEFRTAKAKAKRTGGIYHVGRCNDNGSVVFNISFPTGECG